MALILVTLTNLILLTVMLALVTAVPLHPQSNKTITTIIKHANANIPLFPRDYPHTGSAFETIDIASTFGEWTQTVSWGLIIYSFVSLFLLIWLWCIGWIDGRLGVSFVSLSLLLTVLTWRLVNERMNMQG
jgi:hypothetical protein